MSEAPDLTLDEVRTVLAPLIADGAAFDGWSDEGVRNAAAASGIDPAIAAIAFPRGAMEMIGAWIGAVDAAMERAFPADRLAPLKIRERIRQLVTFRLEAVAGREESLRRALAIMAMPQNVAQSLKLGWASADRMWRLAGDSAMDIAHYTKRATLAGIYAATLAVFIDDESEGKADTLAFLDRRIDGIIRFEKAKARFAGSRNNRFSPARFLGRLRYPAH